MQSVLIKGDGYFTRDLTEPECDVGFLGILLSCLFFLNAKAEAGLSVYFSRNKHKQAHRFVPKPHGEEELQMLFYRFTATILFFASPVRPLGVWLWDI